MTEHEIITARCTFWNENLADLISDWYTREEHGEDHAHFVKKTVNILEFIIHTISVCPPSSV